MRTATALALVHALDDALINRQPGVDLDHHALAAAISLAAGIAAIVAFPRMRPGFRAAVALVFGALAATNGSMHVIHITKDGPANSDVTGALAMVAGLSLIGLALWIPWLRLTSRLISVGLVDSRWAPPNGGPGCAALRSQPVATRASGTRTVSNGVSLPLLIR